MVLLAAFIGGGAVGLYHAMSEKEVPKPAQSQVETPVDETRPRTCSFGA